MSIRIDLHLWSKEEVEMKDTGSCWVCGSWWWGGLLKAVLGTRHCQNLPPSTREPQTSTTGRLSPPSRPKCTTPSILKPESEDMAYCGFSLWSWGRLEKSYSAKLLWVWGRGARLAHVRTSRGMGCLLGPEDMFIFKLSRIVDRVLKVWNCREGRVFGPQVSAER
jgi:hypothetical protein